MNKNIEIYATLGPSSINRDFLKFANKKISLLRINMSHVEITKLRKILKFIKKFSKVPICIDTEGAQIRTRVKKRKFLKEGQQLKILKNLGNFNIYPPEVFNKIKRSDILKIGFDGLEVKVVRKKEKKILCKTIASGSLDNNKGVLVSNRNIKLKFITEKDIQAINIAKQMNVKNFALSFTNSKEDIYRFNSLLKGMNKIFKIESKTALKNLKEIIPNGAKFLIDRGDLSKEVSTEKLPNYQRKIIRAGLKKKKRIYVATNFLESMGGKRYPTLAEANDIYNTLEMGASGLVLSSETAIGKYPKECIIFLNKMIKTFNKF